MLEFNYLAQSTVDDILECRQLSPVHLHIQTTYRLAAALAELETLNWYQP